MRLTVGVRVAAARKHSKRNKHGANMGHGDFVYVGHKKKLIRMRLSWRYFLRGYRINIDGIKTFSSANVCYYFSPHFTMRNKIIHLNECMNEDYHTVCPNKKETRFSSEISSLPRNF